MNRDDALRKVKALLATAAEGGPQADAFQAKAIELRLRHGISDDDLVESEIEDLVIFGHRLFLYARHVRPIIDKAHASLAEAIKLIGEEVDSVELLERLRKDLLAEVEHVTEARNEGIRRSYNKLRQSMWPEWDDESDGPHAHRMAVQWIKGDMRKDVVERILGVSEDSIWKQHLSWVEGQAKAAEARDDGAAVG